MKKRIKLEFFDRAGLKHTIAIEGDVTPEKVNNLLEYAEIVAGSNQTSRTAPTVEGNKMAKLLDVINTRLTGRMFDSRELLESYAETWGNDFSLGGVSTYLSRLVDRGMLERSGSAAHWFYRLRPSQAVQ
jgi:hypothetical protein